MVVIFGACFIAYLWFLSYRYRKIRNVEVSKRTKVLLIILSGFYLLSSIVSVAAYLKN